MSLLSEKTNWVFLLASGDEPEERHIYDIAFGVFCLEKKGISPENLTLIIDGENRTRINSLISNATDYNYSILRSNDLYNHFKGNTFTNIVLFVTGHGNIDGIAGPNPLKPYPLIQAIKNSPGLILGVIYLGQCYAGIFNYMNVAKKEDCGQLIKPPLILIGATNLFNSISAATQEDFLHQPKNWVANLFLLYLFKWILEPQDVDGDGKFTIMDSYKFAGALSNDSNKQIKGNGFLQPFSELSKITELQSQIDKTKKESPSSSQITFLELELSATRKKFENALDIQFNHQESWILNSIPAQEIIFQ